MDEAAEEIEFDPDSPECQETLARMSYERDMSERAAALSEHAADLRIWMFTWPHLSADEKRPYRAAVAECMRAVKQAYGS